MSDTPPDAEISEAPPNRSWWGRPAGGREVLTVSAPLVVSSLSWTVMTFVDRIFLKEVSGEAMTAAFNASNLWFLLVCLPWGISMYVGTFVSQYHGAKNPQRIGPAVWQGVWLALLSTPVVLAAMPFAGKIFAAAAHPPEVMRLEVTYFQAILWGAPAILFAQAFSSFYSGRGKTRIVMVVDALFALLNVLLDYLWIFGLAGFPEMGIAGAAWATVVSLWLKALAYLLLMWLPHNRAQFGTFSGMPLDGALFRRMLYYGGPSGVQLMLDVSGFVLFVLLVSRLGPVQAEATSIAFSISSLAFMPILGLSMGAAILVGQHLGENRDNLAARSTWTTLHVALAYMTSISIVYVFAPQLLLNWFFMGENTPENGQQVYAVAATLLCYVAAYNLLDATLMVFVSAIKGAGDTTFVLCVSFVMSSLLWGLSWMGVMHWGFGVYDCWALITGWIWTLGVVFFLRFLQGKWRTMRVIESAPPDLEDRESPLPSEPAVEA